MKKPIILALICSALLLMPALSALPIKKASINNKTTDLLSDFDGTFIGGFGVMSRENEEWQFEYYGYIGGVYKNNDKYTILHGKIFDLEKQPIGNLTIITTKSILIGKINNLEGGKVPVVGFFLTNKDNFFAGRFMSLFGPAPHIWGEFTSN